MTPLLRFSFLRHHGDALVTAAMVFGEGCWLGLIGYLIVYVVAH